jgi:LPS O-antigen subunit length determinant protein (WzzB/FepE family)
MNELRHERVGEAFCEEAIDLLDVISFFTAWWKFICASGAAAAIAALAYAKIVPEEYQAQALIMVAKAPGMAIPVPNWAVGNGITYANVESPEVLAERMAIPTTYPSQVVAKCQFASQEELLGHLRISPANGISGTFRFSLLHRSPALAVQCTEAVAAMVRAQQAELLAAAIERRNSGLAKGQAKLPGIEARLLAPIYAPTEPVSPQKKQLVAAWGAGGLFAGVLAGLCWTLVGWYRRKSTASNWSI